MRHLKDTDFLCRLTTWVSIDQYATEVNRASKTVFLGIWQSLFKVSVICDIADIALQKKILHKRVVPKKDQMCKMAIAVMAQGRKEWVTLS